MMSLGVSKGGVIPPSEEDRKKIIRQMKVRTTLKGDKSWIYPQNSDNEEETKSSPLHSPCRSDKIDGGSPASASVTPHGNRLPSSKPTSGYLIRGVFTRTIDKTPPESTFYSNGTQKSSAAQAKSASLPCFSSGYKMTTEDYKKLAPFNVRQISVESDEEKPAFSPDEHKKRTEAANSVLRRTASRERSYVLSAAKKSNGSPTQEVPPFIAKRVEIEEEGGRHMKSQTLPPSSRFGLGGKSDKVDEEKPVGTSPGEATTSKPTLATGRSEERVMNVLKPIPQSEIKLRVTSSPEKSDKPVKEEPDLISWDESIPKATTISTGESSCPWPVQPQNSEVHPQSSHLTLCGRHKGCHETRKQNASLDQKSEVPLTVISLETSSKGYPDSLEVDNEFDPIKSNSYHMDNTADPPSGTRHRYRVPECLDDTNSDFTRSSPQSKDIPAHPTDARFTVPGYLGDTECDPKRSVPCYEERHPTREIRYESTRATEHKEPELNVTKSSPSSGDNSAVTQEVRYKVPMHLDNEEFDFKRSSSHSTESNVTINDPRHRITGHVEAGELDPERTVPGYEGRSSPRDTRYESPRARGHNEFDPSMERLPSASSERISMSTASSQYHSSSVVGHKSNPNTASKGILFVKEYVNSREFSPRYSSDSLVDLSDIERANYLHSSTSQRSCDGVCTYCGHEIRDCPKIMIDHLNVYCHEYCFRCGICHKAMGDLLDKIFIHRDIVHCDQCYEKLF
ncbi:zinc finger protein 185 isoform X2 [Chelonoidis abingdonii]|uniref:zinc finger protein 185 isoform X2 n=1 Tax=Chelonoidis abingdonii TaxID=106734 RepID=UPI0013F238B1|nr:zinc finger protein 185 isoform X2 [Chelonoidis abingdonii]